MTIVLYKSPDEELERIAGDDRSRDWSDMFIRKDHQDS
jgi:hypothetical protein